MPTRTCTCVYAAERGRLALQCSRTIEPGTIFCAPCTALLCYDPVTDQYGGTHPHTPAVNRRSRFLRRR